MSTKFPKIFKGGRKGKTSVILAGIHGNETCGIKAFKKILQKIKIDRGTVIFDIGNPKAVKNNVRFNDFNLNRVFQNNKFLNKNELNSYEYKRSKELIKILNSADALLDIHSSLNPDSKKFIICQPKSNSIANKLPFLLKVKNIINFEKGSTDGYMHENNKIGICIECGQHLDPKAVTLAEKSILKFLIAMGHIKGKNINYKQKEVKIFSLYKNISTDFILHRKFKDFEKIKRGTQIGIDGNTIIRAPKDCSIIFAHNIKSKPEQECFLLGI